MTEWTAFSQKTHKLVFLQAETHKEAIKKAVNQHDIIPENVNDVRPRTHDKKVMKKQEFEKYMEAGLV